MNYPSFLSLEPEHCAYDTSRYAILPVPYDGTSTWGKGADRGPEALLEASDQLEYYDPETGIEACFKGIHVDNQPFTFSADASGVGTMVEEVRLRIARFIADGKIPVVVGGEHSVSTGAIYAAAEAYSDLTVLQIDAHSDLRDSYQGSRFNHACIMARAREKAGILQVAIRASAREEQKYIDTDRIWWDHLLHGSDTWIGEVIAKINGPVYITCDLDGLDPAVLPSTGTPQPGGLSWREALALLRAVFGTGKVIGWDITELCPDGTRTSPFVAASLLYKMICYHAKNEKE